MGKTTEKKTGTKKQPAAKKTTRSGATTTPKKQPRTSKLKELNSEIERLTQELNDLKDKYLRKAAEFDNYKKRKDKEILDILERATDQLCLELLPVIDDFERSLNTETKRKSYKSLREGIELIYKKFLAILKNQGIEPIEAVGQPFDPNLHDAIMQVEDQEKPSNIVVDEALKGYRRKDKVLRHSQVIVNK